MPSDRPEPLGPRASLTRAGKARNLSKKQGAPPKKPGPKRRRRTDITLPRELIDAVKVQALKEGHSVYAYQRLAIRAYAKYRLQNPIEPRALHCTACGRAFAAPRSQGDKKRLRVTTNLDAECVQLMTYMADTYYHGVFSHTFEAAVRYYMGDAAPAPARGEEP